MVRMKAILPPGFARRIYLAGREDSTQYPSFFEPRGSVYLATEATRGPWDEKHQHAGPPSGLLGRAFERLEPREDARIVRVTVEILRPVPIAEVEIEATVVRPGKRVELLEAVMTSQGDAV